jgi:hypothetical protein
MRASSRTSWLFAAATRRLCVVLRRGYSPAQVVAGAPESLGVRCPPRLSAPSPVECVLHHPAAQSADGVALGKTLTLECRNNPSHILHKGLATSRRLRTKKTWDPLLYVGSLLSKERVSRRVGDDQGFVGAARMVWPHACAQAAIRMMQERLSVPLRLRWRGEGWDGGRGRTGTKVKEPSCCRAKYTDTIDSARMAKSLRLIVPRARERRSRNLVLRVF